MIRIAAFLGAALGAVYADPGDSSLINGTLLPFVFIACLAYLFWFQGFVVLVLGAVSWYFMDLASGDWFSAGLLPLLFGVFLLYFFWWLCLGLFSAGEWRDGVDAADGGANEAE